MKMGCKQALQLQRTSAVSGGRGTSRTTPVALSEELPSKNRPWLQPHDPPIHNL